jgi:hypothetical protein
MADDESDKRAFGRIADRKRGDTDTSYFETADHFEQLSDPIFEK